MRLVQLLRHKLFGGPPPPPATETDPDILELRRRQHRVFNRAQVVVGRDWRDAIGAMRAEARLVELSNHHESDDGDQ